MKNVVNFQLSLYQWICVFYVTVGSIQPFEVCDVLSSYTHWFQRASTSLHSDWEWHWFRFTFLKSCDLDWKVSIFSQTLTWDKVCSLLIIKHSYRPFKEFLMLTLSMTTGLPSFTSWLGQLPFDPCHNLLWPVDVWACSLYLFSDLCASLGLTRADGVRPQCPLSKARLLVLFLGVRWTVRAWEASVWNPGLFTFPQNSAGDSSNFINAPHTSFCRVT